jgi:hypothetical protein
LNPSDASSIKAPQAFLCKASTGLEPAALGLVTD